MGLDNWKSYEDAEQRGSFSGFLKWFILLVVCGVIVGSVGYGLGWFGEAAQVAQQQFGPKVALQKYEWFKEQSASIQKMDKDISLFQQRLEAVDTQYAEYGDKKNWQPDIRLQYNQAKQQSRDDLLAIVSQRNNLVKEYNAASSKFNWSLFSTNPDKPRESFEEYISK